MISVANSDIWLVATLLRLVTNRCKSKRCSKDLGIACELGTLVTGRHLRFSSIDREFVLLVDPRFICKFKEQHCTKVFAEHLPTKKKYVGSLVSHNRLG